jgi:uncharacterized protein (DUF2141 family)
MKIFNFAIAVGFLSISNLAHANDLNVTLQQVNGSGGNIVYALYNSEATFTAQDSETQSATLPAVEGDSTITLHDLVAGFYAFTVFHDTNENGVLDRNALGMPKEQFGISNIVRRLWSSPGWDEVKFEVVDGAPTSINVLLKMQ